MHRDAALWLTEEQQEEWIAAKKQVPALTFASFIAFNGLAWISLKIINRRDAVKHPMNQALVKAGICAATHAIVSLAAAAYALVHRDLGHCGAQLFCHDDMSARMMTVHAGYALFEFLYWQNSAAVAQPWNEMLLLHDLVTLMVSIVSLMYPSRLSLVLLPVQQALQLSTLVDSLRRFAAIYKAAWHVRFKLQLAFMAAYILRAIVGAGLSAYVFYWIREHNLWKLDLPEGMSALNAVYGMILLAGTIIQALIYVKWMGSAVAMTNDLVESVSGGKGAAADGKTAAIKALGSGGGGSAKKKARGGRREEKKRR